MVPYTAVITPSCLAIFAKWSGMWLSRGSYGIYMAIMGFTWLLWGVCGNLLVLSAISMGITLGGGGGNGVYMPPPAAPLLREGWPLEIYPHFSKKKK